MTALGFQTGEGASDIPSLPLGPSYGGNSNLVFYAHSTIAVISGRQLRGIYIYIQSELERTQYMQNWRESRTQLMNTTNGKKNGGGGYVSWCLEPSQPYRVITGKGGVGGRYNWTKNIYIYIQEEFWNVHLLMTGVWLSWGDPVWLTGC